MDIREFNKDEFNDVILPESNQINHERFEKLLPHFFYDDDTNERILNYVNNEEEYEIDKALGLDPVSKRRFFYCDNTDKNMDMGYKVYCNIMESIDYYEKIVPWMKKRSVAWDQLINYDTYSTGKIKIGKQFRKLFKLLLDDHILTQEQVNEISSNRSNGVLTLCLTRNPIDYVFCSTNQNCTINGSCLNLESTFSDAFYMGLPAALLDPHRYIFFATNGKINKYTTKNLEFKHFKYIQRSFNLYKDNSSCCLRMFGNQSEEMFKGLMEHLSIKCMTRPSFHTTYCRRSFGFTTGRYVNGNITAIYYDGIGVGVDSNDFIYYGGGCNSITHMSHTGGFSSFEESYLNEDSDEDYFYCDDCGGRYHQEDSYSTNDGLYCEDCFNRSYVNCHHCGEAVYNDDALETINEDYICEYCRNRHYVFCSGCEKYVKMEYSHTTHDGNSLCTECYESDYFTCEECGGVHHDDEESEKAGYCSGCFEDLFFVCKDCKKITSKENESADDEICDQCYIPETEAVNE